MEYKDQCPYCKAPSTNTEKQIICSNDDCWKHMINSITQHIENTKGLTPENPCLPVCPKCKEDHTISDMYKVANGVWCVKCQIVFNYPFIVGKWYLSVRKTYKTTTQFIGAPNFWDYDRHHFETLPKKDNDENGLY